MSIQSLVDHSPMLLLCPKTQAGHTSLANCIITRTPTYNIAKNFTNKLGHLMERSKYSQQLLTTVPLKYQSSDHR